MQELRHVGLLDRPEVDGVLRLCLDLGGLSCSKVSETREGRHQLWITGLGSLLEIRGLEALLCCGSLGGVVPERLGFEIIQLIARSEFYS